jgi:hypothetical protein
MFERPKLGARKFNKPRPQYAEPKPVEVESVYDNLTADEQDRVDILRDILAKVSQAVNLSAMSEAAKKAFREYTSRNADTRAVKERMSMQDLRDRLNWETARCDFTEQALHTARGDSYELQA